jgi:hypothetical protein
MNLDHIDAMVSNSLEKWYKMPEGVTLEVVGRGEQFNFTLPHDKYDQLAQNCGTKATVCADHIRYGNCIISKKA